MTTPQGSPKSPRRYPGFWEKAVPIFLGVLALAVIILLAIIFVVAAGIFPAH
jgi:hypothetical protein